MTDTPKPSHEQCSACGFDGGAFDEASLLAAVEALGPRWRALLGTAGDHLRMRPAPEVWSAIEYAAHSRDITALHRFGVEQALTYDEPAFPAFADDAVDQAAAAYADADPDLVLAELSDRATELAGLARAAGSSQWGRGLTVGDDRMDVRRLLEHALHDSVHHLDDVERGLAQLSG